ncbi:hypothetical protein L0657_06745 [Dyadobacter sp. CY345]|uniref:hypothetical protein n=1 Tax=Dyadobacter sp. CY345 TaxID=2909335 RepID=UPI001F32EACA|nr:hypothetical protein [Dyadobacter sp. CY345]MCF2443648.1 hypothetical protein [Dyadobacter sp. CY345]
MEKPEIKAETAAFKTQQIEIIKFHPLVAHEVGEQPIVREETAKDLIERKFAKAIK